MKTFLYVIIGILLIGYFFFSTQNKEPGTSIEEEVVWTMIEVEGDDIVSIKTHVKFTFRGKTYDAGVYNGSCSEVQELGGIDGKGLLENEISAVQCFFAGGGNEIGIFKYGDFYIANLGVLEEGDAETPFFRGTFEGLLDIQ